MSEVTDVQIIQTGQQRLHRPSTKKKSKSKSLAQKRKFGPGRPPFKWSGDLPGPILDSIIDYLDEGNAYDHSQCPPGCKLPHDPEPCFKLLENASLVSRAFRENIFRRKVVKSVTLAGPAQVKWVEESVSMQTRKYIREVVLGYPKERIHDDMKWSEQIAQFMNTLPNVEQVHDDGMFLCRWAIPPMMLVETLAVPLPPEDIRVIPVNCPNVRELKFQLIRDGSVPREVEIPVLPQKLKDTVAHMFQDALKEVYLPIPGCLYKDSIPYPTDVRVPDLLGDTFPELEKLSLSASYMEPGTIMFDGCQSNPVWDTYLGWLTKTRATFKHLHFDLMWHPSLMANGGAVNGLTLAMVVESYGMQFPWIAEYKKSLEPSSPKSAQSISTFSPSQDKDRMAYCNRLFKKFPMLESVKITVSTSLAADGLQVPLSYFTSVRKPNGHSETTDRFYLSHGYELLQSVQQDMQRRARMMMQQQQQQR